MLSPTQFMSRYKALQVSAVVEDPVRMVSRPGSYRVQLDTYFLMKWAAGTEERRDYDEVTRGSNRDAWFNANKESIRTAAMGKGAPGDYELALEWAVRSGRIPNVSQAALQTYCNEHLGIDCSGFVTNYLIACGKLAQSADRQRNTGAASYYNTAKAVNDPTQVRQGDLLVWMSGNAVKTNPGHIAVVESYVAGSVQGGNMKVVEATGADGANPKLLESRYVVEQIIPKGGAVPVMILVVKRHGVSGSRVAVMRP